MQRYVYGIIRTPELVEFDVAGLGPDGPQPVSMPLGDGLAMVSSPLKSPNLRATRKHMLAHTRVLEEVIKTHDVLPMRFGTVLPEDADGTSILNTHRAAFADAFADVEGCRELSLKVSWREGIAFEEVMAADEGLRAARDALAHRDPGESHYERITLGQRVEAGISARRDEEAKALRLRLAHLCTRFTEASITDDMMIANFAMLVTPEQETALDAAINLIDDVHGGRIDMKYVGPMPPFSFVELSIDSADMAAG